jgi:hypothetical protein
MMTLAEDVDFDVVVIGRGPGGYAACGVPELVQSI